MYTVVWEAITRKKRQDTKERDSATHKASMESVNGSNIHWQTYK